MFSTFIEPFLRFTKAYNYGIIYNIVRLKMKIGIRAHDIKKTNSVELIEQLHEHNLNYIQLVLRKALNFEGSLSEAKAKEIFTPFKDNGIEVAMLGSYFNPIHSNLEKVNHSILTFKEHLKYASSFGTKFVGTETGSYNDDKWTYNPKNHTEEAYQKVRTIVKDLVLYAQQVNSIVVIEGAYNHVIHHPTLLKRLVDEINSPHLKVTIDIYNYLNIQNHQQHREIFDTCLNLLKDDIVIFHLKDYIVKDGKLFQVGLGQGLIDYQYIIPKINKHTKDAYLIMEGITGEDINSSINYIKKMRSNNE